MGNEPAFPQCETSRGNPFHTEFPSGEGLTKREYFAAMAMQGLLATPAPVPFKQVADMAVRHADELIEALERISP